MATDAVQFSHCCLAELSRTDLSCRRADPDRHHIAMVWQVLVSVKVGIVHGLHTLCFKFYSVTRTGLKSAPGSGKGKL